MNVLTGRHWDLLAGELELDTKPEVSGWEILACLGKVTVMCFSTGAGWITNSSKNPAANGKWDKMSCGFLSRCSCTGRGRAGPKLHPLQAGVAQAAGQTTVS